MGPARDGAQDVEIGDQRLGGRGVRVARRRAPPSSATRSTSNGSVRTSSRVAIGPGDVDLIEPADLAGGQPMRHDRLDEAHAVGRVGARQRHEVLHRGVRDELAVAARAAGSASGSVAHQTEAPRHPAHAAIEAPRQRLERQPVILDAACAAASPARARCRSRRCAAAAERSAPRAPASPRGPRRRCRAAAGGGSGPVCGRPRRRRPRPSVTTTIGIC